MSLGFSSRYLKTDAARIAKRDTEMFQDESWKVVANLFCGQKVICRGHRSQVTKHYRRGSLHSSDGCWLFLVWSMCCRYTCIYTGAWEQFPMLHCVASRSTHLNSLKYVRQCRNLVDNNECGTDMRYKITRREMKKKTITLSKMAEAMYGHCTS